MTIKNEIRDWTPEEWEASEWYWYTPWVAGRGVLLASLMPVRPGDEVRVRFPDGSIEECRGDLIRRGYMEKAQAFEERLKAIRERESRSKAKARP